MTRPELRSRGYRISLGPDTLIDQEKHNTARRAHKKQKRKEQEPKAEADPEAFAAQGVM